LQRVHFVGRLGRTRGGRQPALLHRGRGQRRESDDIAHRIDVVHRGAEVLVDLDPAAGIGGQAGRRQVERLGHACRPAEYITVSAGIFLPLSNSVIVPRE